MRLLFLHGNSKVGNKLKRINFNVKLKIIIGIKEYIKTLKAKS